MPSPRDSQLRGRDRLTGLLSERPLIDHEMSQAGERFERLSGDISRPRVVSSHNLFQTPDPIAAEMAGLLQRQGRILEPSAGLGRLYRAIRQRDSESLLTLVDSSVDCCRELYLATEKDSACRLIQGDFLEQSPELLGLFDGILMNPPFRLREDIAHILHAKKFLAPGGRLVGLCADSHHRGSKLRADCCHWQRLPKRSFAAEGTAVGVVLFAIQRPAELEAISGRK